jgi:hypothetical protein
VKTLIWILKVFTYAWSGLVILAVVVVVVLYIIQGGLEKVLTIFSPLSWGDAVVLIVLLSPAIGTNILAKHLERKMEK